MDDTMQKFQKKVLDFYAKQGRHNLPWRATIDPYAILVSEIMLQQTQVDRVVPKYTAFLKQFPNVSALAKAPLSDVIIAWSGLGYNRRAQYLKKAAEAVVEMYGGVFPQTIEGLQKLPGVGPYTAGAVSAFAYNQPVVCIETNIRRVFIHEFFPDAVKVFDAEILPLIEKNIYRKNPRQWYWALMDYGSYLKTQIPNPNQRSVQYAKQSVFKGSVREVRGAVLRLCSASPVSKSALFALYPPEDAVRVQKALDSLASEGLITLSKKGIISLG